MKTIGEFLEDLSFGPLAGISIGSEGDGTIKADKLQRVVALTDGGLQRLYSKFNLREKSFFIATVPLREEYPLELKHTVASGELGEDHFIVDSEEEPFKFDIIKIIKAFTEKVDGEGLVEIPLNDEGNVDSVYIPDNKLIQIPHNRWDNLYGFTYQARHEDLDPNNTEQLIQLPRTLHQALESWVASKIFGSMNGVENRARSIELMSFYEIACSEVVERDLANTSLVHTTDKLENRGFK
jgi:hypothetical protein